MTKIYYLTPEGKEKLEQELKHLLSEKRAEIASRLRAAIEQGDLSENADYIKAKEDQGFVEGRIQELETMLANVELIDKKKSNGVVVIGSKITVQEGKFDPETYTMVGAAEANPREGKISNESPIGLALLGKKKGDKVEVAAPSGSIQFEILAVK